jgi:glycogen operon protein
VNICVTSVLPRVEPPIHAFIHDRNLTERGLRNYWGYNTIGFFAPHPEYLGAEGSCVQGVRTANAHAGIEVIPTLLKPHCRRQPIGADAQLGIDNKSITI